jgi:hypothetical protein
LACEPIKIDEKEFLVQKVTLSDSSGIVAVVKPKKSIEGCEVLMISIPGQPELSKEELRDHITKGIRERLMVIRREKVIRVNRRYLKNLANHFNHLLGIDLAPARFR